MEKGEAQSQPVLDRIIQRLLILGLVLSTAVLLAGLALSAVSGGSVPSQVLSFKQILAGLRDGSPSSLLNLGLLMLIATPVLAVMGALVHFVAKRDWRFVVAALLVLLVLAASTLIGMG